MHEKIYSVISVEARIGGRVFREGKEAQCRPLVDRIKCRSENVPGRFKKSSLRGTVQPWGPLSSLSNTLYTNEPFWSGLSNAVFTLASDKSFMPTQHRPLGR